MARRKFENKRVEFSNGVRVTVGVCDNVVKVRLDGNHWRLSNLWNKPIKDAGRTVMVLES